MLNTIDGVFPDHYLFFLKKQMKLIRPIPSFLIDF